MYNYKKLIKRINRLKNMCKYYENNNINTFNVYGGYDYGYLKGKIEILEEILEEIKSENTDKDIDENIKV